MQKQINYYSRDFKSIRSDLINFVKNHYPDTYVDFNDASIGMMLLELNAATGSMLSFNTDRVAQETMIDSAQERKSVYNLSRTFGLKIPNKIPSVTICDISVDIPVLFDSFDISYCPILIRGAQVVGNGLIFELSNDVDFSSPYSQYGVPNRKILPNVDSNGVIVSYTLIKREIVTNGQTKYFKKIITESDTKPFLQIVLPESDVISVDSLITLNGTNYSRLPTLLEWLNESNKWYEVESLAEQSIFTTDYQTNADTNILVGKWKKVNRRFITENTDRGYTIIRFGNGVVDTSTNNEYVSDSSQILEMLDNQINKYSLGEKPTLNTTMFIKYRTGGGIRTNVGSNVLTSFGDVNLIVNGVDGNKNTKVRSSLKVTNPLPALGGRDELSVTEVRNLTKFNFVSQNSCIKLPDYYNRVMLMNKGFGAPYRVSVVKNDNKVEIITMGLDSSSKLSNVSTSTLKENIANYLQRYKGINDYVIVSDGKIINIGVEVKLFINKFSDRSEITDSAVQLIKNYFAENQYFGQNLYLSNLYEVLNNIGGVLNVVDVKVFNKIDPSFYSLNKSSMPIKNTSTLELNLDEMKTIFVNFNEIYEIKYINDIKVSFIY